KENGGVEGFQQDVLADGRARVPGSCRLSDGEGHGYRFRQRPSMGELIAPRHPVVSIIGCTPEIEAPGFSRRAVRKLDPHHDARIAFDGSDRSQIDGVRKSRGPNTL